MTLSTTTSRVPYAGSGSTGPFAFPFKIFSSADLLVTKRSAAGVETVLALGNDYSVAGVGNASGTVTTVAAVAATETIYIRRKPALTQPTSIRNLGPYFAATHEDAFDRLAMQLQSIQDQVDRSLKLKESIAGVASFLELEPETGKAVVGTGTGFTMATLDSSAVALPGNGRTVPTLSTYLANNAVFNAKDWGVTGDGVTDDTTKMSNAMAGVSGAGGGTLLAPKGTYLLAANTVTVIGGNNYSGALVQPSNVTLVGVKGATTFKAKANYAANGNIILWNGVSKCAVRDIAFDGNIANQTLVTVTDNGFSAIKIHNNSTDVEITGCSFTGFTQDCIFFGYPNGTAVDGLLVSGCVFSDFQRGGVVGVSGRNIRIIGNVFRDSTRGLGSVATGSNGVWLEPNVATDPLENIVISSNTFRNLNGGCWLYNAQQTDLFTVTVIGNTFNSCDAGVYGVSAWGARILGNTFHSCGLNATASKNKPVYLNNCRWASVIGNEFRDCGGEKGDVELAQASWFAMINSNTFKGSQRDCIHVEMSATQFGMPTVIGNRIESGGVSAPNTYYGITIKCPGGTPGEDGNVSHNHVATSIAAGLAAAFRIENWQGGIFDDNFPVGTGLPVSQVGSFLPGYGSAVWDPPSIAAGAQSTTTVTVAGANFTDASSYDVIAPYTLSGLHAFAYCSAINTVTIVLVNNTAGAVDLGSGTWGIKMRRRY